MARKPRIVDALSPLDAITSVLAGIIITLLALGSVWALFDHSVSVFGVGEDTVCIKQGFTMDDGSGDPDRLERDLFDLRDGVTTYGSSTNVCREDAGVVDQLLLGLTQGPTTIVFVGFLLRTRRTIAFARRHGLFSSELAARVERLGWMLLIGLVGAAVVEWFADGQLAKRLLTDQSWAGGSFSVSVAGIIGAYGIISVGRVMAHAARLQADSDATI